MFAWLHLSNEILFNATQRMCVCVCVYNFFGGFESLVYAFHIGPSALGSNEIL